MTVDLATCVAFANENPICFLATSEDDQPHARALGLHFQTGTVKDLSGPFLKALKPGSEAYGLVLFRIAHGIAGSVMG
jgi:hypothetical protein